MHRPRRFRWVRIFAAGLVAAGCASAAVGYSRWRDLENRAELARLMEKPSASEEDLRRIAALVASREHEEEEFQPGEGEREQDDPLLRRAANRLRWGNPGADARAEWSRIAREEAVRWAHLMPRPPRSAADARLRSAPLPGSLALPWLNVGPADSVTGSYGGNGVVDSGRLCDIRVNPLSPATVYLASAGGGVWKTLDFGASPSWFPVTDGLGNLALGAMDMDPADPETLYIGTGDPHGDSGGQVHKTEDGGLTWSEGVSLSGSYAGGWSLPNGNLATNIRSIRVDPSNRSVVLVGADTALFRSGDAGASFSLLSLPNPGTDTISKVWSIVYTGSVSGVSRWAASGEYWNSTTGAWTGDIWTSTNAGATWSSRGSAGALPLSDASRITLGAGTPSGGPPSAVVYAVVAAADGTTQAGIWRSTDSGNTFAVASGTLSNPTLNWDCTDTDVASDQADYNQAVAVDPADSSRVIVGGTLCAIRTRNGLAASPVWDNVTHWYGGFTASGALPYVHADWHTALIVRSGSTYRVFAGTDGGIAYSDNVFNPDTVTASTVAWVRPSRGLVTAQEYAVASGDPVTGDPFVVLAGAQDNGTSIRDSQAKPTAFDQVVGGDGIGTTVVSGGRPATTIYWASSQYKTHYCNPDAATGKCHYGWTQLLPTLSCSGDSMPFLVSYAAVPTATSAPTALTASSRQVFRIAGDPASGPRWTAVSPCSAATLSQVVASPTVDGLYGAAVSGAKFWVTSNCTAGTTSCTWTQTATLASNVNPLGGISCDETATYASSIAFPPSTPSGKNPGDVFVAASVGAYNACGSGDTLVSASLGHLFVTTDRGATWTPLHGNGTGFDLPNVPIDVVRYDPNDSANNTLYVGTNLGMYATLDGGLTWRRLGAAMPMAKVTDLFVGRAGNLLRASTYGRGIWEFHPRNISTAAGTGDLDGNGQIDAADLLGLAARLGTQPGNSSEPFYDFAANLGGTSTVEESDLSALTAKFGGAP